VVAAPTLQLLRRVILSRSEGRQVPSLYFPFVYECDLRQWRCGVRREGHEGSDLERIFFQMVVVGGATCVVFIGLGGKWRGLPTKIALMWS
jgi:hypothetical protein